jgi:hypothetical protein
MSGMTQVQSFVVLIQFETRTFRVVGVITAGLIFFRQHDRIAMPVVVIKLAFKHHFLSKNILYAVANFFTKQFAAMK